MLQTPDRMMTGCPASLQTPDRIMAGCPAYSALWNGKAARHSPYSSPSWPRLFVYSARPMAHPLSPDLGRSILPFWRPHRASVRAARGRVGPFPLPGVGAPGFPRPAEAIPGIARRAGVSWLTKTLLGSPTRRLHAPVPRADERAPASHCGQAGLAAVVQTWV